MARPGCPSRRTRFIGRLRTASVDIDVVARGYWSHALQVPGLGQDLLDGLNFASSPSIEVWPEAERGRMRATAQSVLREAALARLAAGAAAVAALDVSTNESRHVWTAFLPWPQSLRAEVERLRGRVVPAAKLLEQAFALGCQRGDPCWEGIAGRGLGRVAMACGQP